MEGGRSFEARGGHCDPPSEPLPKGQRTAPISPFPAASRRLCSEHCESLRRPVVPGGRAAPLSTRPASRSLLGTTACGGAETPRLRKASAAPQGARVPKRRVSPRPRCPLFSPPAFPPLLQGRRLHGAHPAQTCQRQPARADGPCYGEMQPVLLVPGLQFQRQQ